MPIQYQHFYYELRIEQLCLFMSSIVIRALTMKVVTPYQKEPWTNACKGGIRSALQYMGKGCFDLSETQYDTYTKSKMFKLLNVIKFNMQDALRYLVQNSCHTQMFKTSFSFTIPSYNKAQKMFF